MDLHRLWIVKHSSKSQSVSDNNVSVLIKHLQVRVFVEVAVERVNFGLQLLATCYYLCQVSCNYLLWCSSATYTHKPHVHCWPVILLIINQWPIHTIAVTGIPDYSRSYTPLLLALQYTTTRLLYYLRRGVPEHVFAQAKFTIKISRISFLSPYKKDWEEQRLWLRWLQITASIYC